MTRSPTAPTLSVLVLLAGVGACDSTTTLPGRPSVHTLSVSAVDPGRAFAGDTVTIHGAGFSADRARVRVTMGGSAPIEPLSTTADTILVLVPGDATSGTVTVETPDGRANAPESFSFLGLGRLRLGRIDSTAALEPLLEAAIVDADRRFVVDADRYAAAAWLDDEWDPRPSGLKFVRTAAPREGANAGLVVLDNDRTGAAKATKCQGHLTVLQGQAVVRRITLAEEDPDCLDLTDLALDASNTWAAAASSTRVVVVNLETSETRTFPVENEAHVAGAGVGRFVFLTLFGMHRLQLTGTTWKLDPEDESVLEVDTDYPVDVAGTPAGVVALLTENGRITTLDASTWPPRVLGRFGFFHHEDYDGRIAFSADGSVIGVSHLDTGSFATFRVTGEAIASTAIDRPRDATARNDGLFIVAGRGGWTAVSATTGLRLDFGRVSARAAPASLRSVTAAAGTRLVIESASVGFERILRFDAGTLAPVEGESLRMLEHGAPLDEVASVAASGDLFVLRGRSLVRIGPAVTAKEETIEVPFPDTMRPVSLQLSADGRVAVAGGYDPGVEHERYVLLDGSNGWAQPRSVTLTMESFAVRALVTATRLVLVDDRRVQVFDVATVLEQGQAARPLFDVAVEASILERELSRGRLWFIAAEGAAVRLSQLDLETGVVVRGDPFAAPAARIGMAMSPSAAQIWFVAAEGVRRLVGFPISSGVAGRADAPVVLGDFVSDPLVTPDGEGVFLRDNEHDRLLLVR